MYGGSGSSAAENITVMLVDDQQLVRGGLKMLVDSQPDLQVVMEANDGAAAVDSYARLAEQGRAPNIVLMDVRMPVLDGLQAATRILEMNVANSHVIMLTTFDVDEYVYSAVRAGASGFLLKDAPPEELLGAVRTVFHGDAVIAPSATRRLLQHMIPMLESAAGDSGGADSSGSGEVQAVPQHRELIESLTRREFEVLKLVAEGLSNAEVGKELVLSEATVKTHVSHVLGKLDARDRVQAVIIAYEAGIVS